MSDSILIAVAMGSYMAVIIGIGLYYAKRSNSSTEEYFLGGRSLGPYVTALSAGASDMSGWLLMCLPGLAYWSGIGSPFWTAVGLAIGTYLNWLIVAKRLRVYSTVVDDAITLPDYFSNRSVKGTNTCFFGITADNFTNSGIGKSYHFRIHTEVFNLLRNKVLFRN